jgi:hypothetical protein
MAIGANGNVVQLVGLTLNAKVPVFESKARSCYHWKASVPHDWFLTLESVHSGNSGGRSE